MQGNMPQESFTRRISVIIPTLNEASLLSGLLAALQTQTRPPDEIIVADAGSTDGTIEIARAHGVRVVAGGMPGPGRNAGARAAHGDVFLFLDADVLPHSDFLELALGEFEANGYGVATCPTEALSAELIDKIIMEAANLYLQIVMPISPRAPGFCIFALRSVHQAIGGFDETLIMSEDHDYVRRALQYGDFGLLTSTHIPVSMRRLEKEGVVGLALKYAWCEMYALAGKPIRAIPFKYEFGAFETVSTSADRLQVDLERLRQHLGQFANPLQHFSRLGREQLDHWMEMDPVQFTREHIRHLLESRDLSTMSRYLQARLAFSPQTQAQLSKNWAKLKMLPKEAIRLLESDDRDLPPSANSNTGADRRT